MLFDSDFIADSILYLHVFILICFHANTGDGSLYYGNYFILYFFF